MRIKKLLFLSFLIISIISETAKVFALNDGAYLIGRSTSYVNPLTGSTEDGGTNITLGDSMIANIVESQLLLEQVNGKYYVTVGLGLASQISQVKFKIMSSSGSFSEVSASITGSSSANGDTVNHYRIQLTSLDVYISPIMYVTPMGRDVQFFIKPNIDSAVAGTGVYTSQMLPSNSIDDAQTDTQTRNDSSSHSETQNDSNSNSANVQTTENVNSTVETITAETLMENVSGLSSYVIDENGKVNTKKKLTVKNLKEANSKTDNTDNQDYFPYIAGSLVCVVLIVVAGGFVYVKKIKK